MCLVCSSSFDTIYFYLATQSSDYRAGQSFPFDISSKEQYSFLNLLSAATESFLPDKDLCYLLSGFFVINLFWWLLPEATYEIHTFLFGSLPCLSQLHPYFLQMFQLLKKYFTLCGSFFFQFLADFLSDSKEKVFRGVWQLGLIHYLVICLCLFRNYLSVSELNCLLISC